MKFDPANSIQDLLQLGEYGDVNPSVTDSATYTFKQAKTMLDTFKGEARVVFFIRVTGIRVINILLMQWQLWRVRKLRG